MNKLFRFLTPLILIAAVIIFAAMGIKSIKAHKTYSETTGVITSITSEHTGSKNTTHHVFVKYSVDGKSYESELNTYSASMKEGQDIQIIYNPEAPDEIEDASYFGVIMLFVVSLMALVMLVVTVLRILRGTF